MTVEALTNELYFNVIIAVWWYNTISDIILLGWLHSISREVEFPSNWNYYWRPLILYTTRKTTRKLSSKRQCRKFRKFATRIFSVWRWTPSLKGVPQKIFWTFFNARVKNSITLLLENAISSRASQRMILQDGIFRNFDMVRKTEPNVCSHAG